MNEENIEKALAQVGDITSVLLTQFALSLGEEMSKNEVEVTSLLLISVLANVSACLCSMAISKLPEEHIDEFLDGLCNQSRRAVDAGVAAVLYRKAGMG